MPCGSLAAACGILRGRVPYGTPPLCPQSGAARLGVNPRRCRRLRKLPNNYPFLTTQQPTQKKPPNNQPRKTTHKAVHYRLRAILAMARRAIWIVLSASPFYSPLASLFASLRPRLSPPCHIGNGTSCDSRVLSASPFYSPSVSSFLSPRPRLIAYVPYSARFARFLQWHVGNRLRPLCLCS